VGQVTIPYIAGVISYVEKELDEMEREEFTRVKMLKSKKEAQLKGRHCFSAQLLFSAATHCVVRAHCTVLEDAAAAYGTEADPANMLANYDTARDPDVVF
jgi:V-type H+-transporting ATPase subunit D